MEITKDMSLGNVIEKYDECTDIMMSHGLHCLGSHVSAEESIEKEAKKQGMTEEELNAMLEEINATVETKKHGITLTKEAAAKIKELLAKSNKQDYGLRVQVLPGGCAGFKYAMRFEKSSTPEDYVIEKDGVNLFIDKNSADLIKGAQVHYVDSLQGAGFKINNPNAKSSCGCGESFG